jgi:hypothetical protein
VSHQRSEPEPGETGSDEVEPAPATAPGGDQQRGLGPQRATASSRLAGDRVPSAILRAQGWLHGYLSNESRVFLGVVIVVTAVVGAIAVSSLRVVAVTFGSLDGFAILTLFLVNWLGNGGVLVPIPGARFIGLLMVFQQAVILPPWQVLLVAGAAMGLGQLSYFVAGARTAQSYAEGDDEGATRIATETGMLDDEATEFAPGGELDAEIVSALSGVSAADRDAAALGRSSSGADDADTPSPGGWRSRFTTSLRRAQDRAQPVLERRGAWGMFMLCFAPTPLGTAAAYVGGLLDFGFRRYLVSSFAAKFLLTAVIVALALVFSDTAQSVALPAVELPEIDWPEFDIGLFELPEFPWEASPAPSPDAGASGASSD